MCMSHLSTGEFADLNALVFEIREIYSDGAWNINVALDQHPSFRRSETARSSLIRSLFLDAAAAAASRIGGFTVKPGIGGTVSLQTFGDGIVDRWFRILQAKAVSDDEYYIDGNRSILKADGDSLIREERWTLAYTIDNDNELIDTFAAEIVDVTAGSPGRLELGEPHHLGTVPTNPGPGEFIPSTEDLDGLDDDEGEAGSESDAS